MIGSFKVICLASEAGQHIFEVEQPVFEAGQPVFEAGRPASEVTADGFEVTTDTSEATLPRVLAESGDVKATAVSGKPETADTIPGSVPVKATCFVTALFTVVVGERQKNRASRQANRQTGMHHRIYRK